MVTKLKLKKLDRRHTGYQFFKYLVEFIGTERSLGLAKYRNYCWSQFGPGVDVATFRKWINELTVEERLEYSINEAWAWQDQDYVTRLYIKGDQELFLLKVAGLIA